MNAPSPDAGGPRGPRLRVVAVNDVYLLDNLPCLAGLIAWARREDPADLLLVTLAGDFLSPSMLSSIDGGYGMVDCLNALGVTHVCFGNHEDDLDRPTLAARLRQLRGVWLSTNLFGFDPELPRHDVVEVTAPDGDTVRVGLLGVCTLDPALYRTSPFDGAPSVDPARALAEDSALLLDSGRCDAIIPLTHLAIAEDRAIARAAAEADGPRYPVLIGGHDHQPFVEVVAGAHIVKTGADAHLAAVIDLAWPPASTTTPGRRRRPRVAVTVHEVAASPPDAELARRVDGHLAKVRELEAATLFVLPEGVALSSVGARARQTSLGALLCSRLRDLFEVDACLLNGGGIRGGRVHTGQFTYGALKAEVPFDNELVVVTLPGRVLADAIAASRARAPAESGGFLQVDDRLRVDAEHRVEEVAGEAFDPDRRYAAVTLRQLFFGMDDIAPLVEYARRHPEAIPPEDAGRETKQALVESFLHKLWDQLGGFTGLDLDGDGVVTREELERAIRTLTAEDPSDLTTRLVFDTFDRDRDGRITPDEAPEAG